MAYISFDQAPSARAFRKAPARRLAWERIGAVAFSLAFWVGLALAIRAIF